LKGFSEKKIIPNTQATDFFEAPFMIKKDGVYYFTYSSGHCEDHTYRVQYATSKTGPMGPLFMLRIIQSWQQMLIVPFMDRVITAFFRKAIIII
jgi:Glycosyl hydrolases family 43.